MEIYNIGSTSLKVSLFINIGPAMFRVPDMTIFR